MGYLVNEIYHDPVDADVVFLGTSPTMHAISPDRLELLLSERLHRKANVRVLALSWGGYDLQYFMLRDYLQHHHPQLVVLEAPRPETMYAAPQQAAHAWYRFGDYADAVSAIPLRGRLQLYGEAVVGGPRQLYSMLRENRLGPAEGGLAEYEAYTARILKHNLLDPSFDPVQPLTRVAVAPPDPVPPPVYSDAPVVRLTEKANSEYSSAFLGLIGELRRHEHLPLA
ncbi:MAG TPA: hypothetical protein VKT78_14035, partial [Fimbriimonadaceae bacterium]|nr:hypothetical protein [Fimbriimonadaceae bacterium]